MRIFFFLFCHRILQPLFRSYNTGLDTRFDEHPEVDFQNVTLNNERYNLLKALQNPQISQFDKLKLIKANRYMTTDVYRIEF
jgi:hypothetical protein